MIIQKSKNIVFEVITIWLSMSIIQKESEQSLLDELIFPKNEDLEEEV